jgi:hypothetical protein
LVLSHTSRNSQVPHDALYSNYASRFFDFRTCTTTEPSSAQRQ